ncbi:MAG: S1 RNA-binding domain-containing protein [Elusimicrobia bacterium]|nr:S1 RNA-binding domain-containing protein [Elusimicrobiota bacterium]MBD3412376.1 S1 RNA-binding domain-containing protein [Elusimicrobiota bacterium]
MDETAKTNETNKDKGEQPMDQTAMVDEICMEDVLKSDDATVPSDSSSGKIISARIVEQTASALLVDVGTKAEGVIPKSEFKEEYLASLNIGDSIPVYCSRITAGDGHPNVSYKKAVEISAWKKIIQAHKDQAVLEGKITSKVKGGFLIDIGIDAFIPASQMDMKPVRKPDEWIGRIVKVMIVEVDRRKKNVIASRRRVEEQAYQVRKNKLMETIKVDDIVEGTVTSIAKFGAFVDIGGIEGLLHVGNISWYRFDAISDVLKIGQTIKVKILKIEQNGDKIALGKKQIEPHPWDGIEQRYKPGMDVSGTISSITNFGVFVQLEHGVEGLLHASEISWKDKNIDPRKVFSNKQQVVLKILDVDRANEKIALSYKRTQDNPWEKAAAQYRSGTRIAGTVTHVTPFGAFVMLPLDIEGLIHVSDMSWVKRIKHPREVVRVGQQLEVVVLEVNVKDEKISLGLKQLTKDPYKKYKNGAHVSGTVKKVMEFGALVSLEPDIDGFVHISELLPRDHTGGKSTVRLSHASEACAVGETIHAKVIRVNPAERKIDLSVKKYEKEMEKKEMEKYMKSDNKLTLGELLNHNEEP